MLRIDGRRRTACDGITRRTLLEAAGAGLLGLNLPGVLAPEILGGQDSGQVQAEQSGPGRFQQGPPGDPVASGAAASVDPKHLSSPLSGQDLVDRTAVVDLQPLTPGDVE